MDKIAVVDSDNALWQFCGSFYLELKSINKDFPAPEMWSSSDFREGYCSESDFMAAFIPSRGVYIIPAEIKG